MDPSFDDLLRQYGVRTRDVEAERALGANEWAMPEPPAPAPKRRDPGSIRNLPDNRWEIQSGLSEGLNPLIGGFAGGQAIGHVAEGKDIDQHLPDAASTVLGVFGLPAAARKGKLPMKRQMSDVEYVDSLKKPRDGKQPLMKYDLYHEPQVNYDSKPAVSLHGFESQEPARKNNKGTRTGPEIALDDPKMRSELNRKLDAGSLESGNHKKNLWYYPTVLEDFINRYYEGPHDPRHVFDRYVDYNASTSMQTAVPANVLEAFKVLHHDFHGRPFSGLEGELTGAARQNKMKISGDIAEGRSFGPGAHKIRNYALNLKGAGVWEPTYRLGEGGMMERVLSPITLDSIMADAMGLVDKAGNPAERWRGPIYRHGMSIVDDLAEQRGMAGADAQAAIWQAHQNERHGGSGYRGQYERQGSNTAYADTHARILDDVINQKAVELGMDPKRLAADLVNARIKPSYYGWAAPVVAPGVVMGLASQEQASPREQ